MIGRSLSHFITLKYETWKFKRLGYHVVVVDRNPEFLEESDYKITLLKPQHKVVVLFAQSFEGCLSDLMLKGYSEPTSKSPIGNRNLEPTVCYTGIVYSCTHMFRSLMILRNSKASRSLEQDYEV